MNREIKFRAWDDLNKKWLFGYELPNLGGFSMLGEVMIFGEYSREISKFSLSDLDKIKLTQYTGLKDKHGNEIYEGDVLRSNVFYESKLGRFLVCFHNGVFFAKRFYKGDGVEEYNLSDAKYYLADDDFITDSPTLVKLMQDDKLKIIGNIFSNPELIK